MSNGRGRDKKLSKEDVWEILKDTDRPVWTASQIAERTDVSKTTAKNRLQEMSEMGGVSSVKVGNAVAYYATERWKGESAEISTENSIATAATDYWEGRFLGGVKDMSVVRSYDDEELRRGDEIQLIVTGTGIRLTRLIGVASGGEFEQVPPPDGFSEEQRKQNEYGGAVATAELDTESFDGPVALLSAELGKRFAVPLVEEELGNFDTHAPELEGRNTEWEFEVRDEVPHLVVAGIGARLLRPWEDAAYLKDVGVVDIEFPEGEDNPLAGGGFHRDMELEIGEETRSEAVEFEDLIDE